MSLILRRSLIFITLLAAGLLIYTLWFGMKADRYDDTAVPYLESALSIVTSWQFEQLRPLLSPTARLEFENQKVQANQNTCGIVSIPASHWEISRLSVTRCR
jgi:nitrogen fixation-related uncharacterized protein